MYSHVNVDAASLARQCYLGVPLGHIFKSNGVGLEREAGLQSPLCRPEPGVTLPEWLRFYQLAASPLWFT